ncbi:ribbon-helix-helix protein, CopG family [Metallosphaera sedula]|uniref:ribbon-helix-helix protein, CopG family n=1 Tax=Metallosphaera sedula TaxID=43687 RepID=UPI0020C0FE53|nr:ribbon-helix-helix protein, CopG family [Metallosphaera sedula]BBL45989.1 hypothetical protein MJ1HA_0076 [Metallosphaera sedula]
MIEKKKERIVVRTTVVVSEETYRTLRSLKAKTGKTMSELLEEAVKLLEEAEEE